MIIHSRQVCFEPIYAVTTKEENTHGHAYYNNTASKHQIQTLKCCMNSLCTPVVVQRELLRFRQESMSPLVFSPEIDYKQFYKPVPHPVVTGSEQKFCEALSYCIGVVELGGSQHLLHEHSLDRQTHKPANHS